MIQNCKNLDLRHIGHFSEIFVPISKVRLRAETNAKMLQLFSSIKFKKNTSLKLFVSSLLSNSNDF